MRWTDGVTSTVDMNLNGAGNGVGSGAPGHKESDTPWPLNDNKHRPYQRWEEENGFSPPSPPT